MKLSRLLLIGFYLITLCQPISIIAQSITFDEAGTYPVVIKDEYGQETKTIYVTVLFPRTQVNESEREAIDAHDISVEKGIFASLTDTELITLAKAHAWNLNDGTNIPITNVERATSQTENSWFQVTFKTARGTATTINVIELEPRQTASTSTFVEQQFYVNFFEFVSSYEMLFLISLYILLPIIILCILYWLTNHRVKKVEQLLYRIQK